MKKRYLYAILFGLPGLLVAGIMALVVFGTAAGVLWIFVFGDNPWPAYANAALPALLVLAFAAVWLASVCSGYFVGKRLEPDPVVQRSHIWISIGITILAVLIIVFYQVRVGNIGPASDSIRCSDFCSRQGYSASSMPPRVSGERSCSCLDRFGQEMIKVPLK